MKKEVIQRGTLMSLSEYESNIVKSVDRIIIKGGVIVTSIVLEETTIIIYK